MHDRLRFPLSLLLVLCGGIAEALAVPSRILPDDPQIERRMRDFIEDARGAPGVIVAVSDGGARRLQAYGASGLAEPRAMVPGLGMEIGSISKGFTGLLLAQMIEVGEVRADDTLAMRMPGGESLPAQVGAITLEDLATHQSGLPRLAGALRSFWRNLGGSDPYRGSTAEELFAAVAAQSPQRIAQRRGRYQYSNFGVALLGQLLALRAGQPYEALLSERVLDPLGIDDARFDAGPAAALLAQGHHNGRAVAPWRMDAHVPAGGLVLTADDLLQLGEHMLAGQPRFVAEAMRPRRSVDDGHGAAGRSGLGWFHDRIGGHAAVWHNGGMRGARSFLAVVPERGWVVVALANGTGDVDALGARLLDPSLPPQRRTVSRLHVALTALGLVGVPLWVGRLLWRGRWQDAGRVRALTAIGDGAVLLVLLARLGDWLSLPFALWWVSLAIAAGMAVLLAWRLRRAAWWDGRGPHRIVQGVALALTVLVLAGMAAMLPG